MHYMPMKAVVACEQGKGELPCKKLPCRIGNRSLRNGGNTQTHSLDINSKRMSYEITMPLSHRKMFRYRFL